MCSGDVTLVVAGGAGVAAHARRKASEISFPSSSASLNSDREPSTSSPSTAALEASSTIPGAAAATATAASVGLLGNGPASAAAAPAQQQPAAASTCPLTTPELLAALGSVGRLVSCSPDPSCCSSILLSHMPSYCNLELGAQELGPAWPLPAA